MADGKIKVAILGGGMGAKAYLRISVSRILP
jgi:hypothetical protein